jgi:hypothetical protein
MEGSEDQGRKGEMQTTQKTQWLLLGRSEKKSRKDGAKPEKASRWTWRSRMTDEKGRRIVENSSSGKIHR